MLATGQAMGLEDFLWHDDIKARSRDARHNPSLTCSGSRSAVERAWMGVSGPRVGTWRRKCVGWSLDGAECGAGYCASFVTTVLHEWVQHVVFWLVPVCVPFCGVWGAWQSNEYPVSFVTHMFVVKHVHRRWWEYCGWAVQWRTDVKFYVLQETWRGPMFSGTR